MPLPFLALAQLGIGLISGAKASSDRKREAARAEKLLASQKPYQTSQYAYDMANDARGRLNAIDPAVLAAQGQLDQSVSNQSAYAQRNAASGAQALALSAAARSQANSQLPMLAAQQAASARNNRQAYYQSLMNLQNEGARTFDSNRDIFSDNINFTLGKMQAASQRQGQGMQTAAMGAGNLLGGMSGGGVLGAMRQQSPGTGGYYPSPWSTNGYTNTAPAAPQVSPGWYGN